MTRLQTGEVFFHEVIKKSGKYVICWLLSGHINRLQQVKYVMFKKHHFTTSIQPDHKVFKKHVLMTSLQPVFISKRGNSRTVHPSAFFYYFSFVDEMEERSIQHSKNKMISVYTLLFYRTLPNNDVQGGKTVFVV